MDKEEMGKEKNVLEEVIKGIIDVADKERKESEPYKNMFKRISSKPFAVQLSQLNDEMVERVLNACTILQGEGIKVTNEAYDFLLALPYLANKLEEDIRKKEGSSCCVDKTYHLLHREFKKLLKLNK